MMFSIMLYLTLTRIAVTEKSNNSACFWTLGEPIARRTHVIFSYCKATTPPVPPVARSGWSTDRRGGLGAPGLPKSSDRGRPQHGYTPACSGRYHGWRGVLHNLETQPSIHQGWSLETNGTGTALYFQPSGFALWFRSQLWGNSHCLVGLLFDAIRPVFQGCPQGR